MLKIRLKNHEGEEIELTPLNFPTICSPLPPRVKVDYPHLGDLQLPDSLDDNSGTIEILIIAADYYWYLVRGENAKGEDGSTAVSIKLGWLFFSPLPDSVVAYFVIKLGHFRTLSVCCS